MGWQWGLKLNKLLMLLRKLKLNVELEALADIVVQCLKKGVVVSDVIEFKADTTLANNKSLATLLGMALNLTMAPTDVKPHSKDKFWKNSVKTHNKINNKMTMKNFVENEKSDAVRT